MGSRFRAVFGCFGLLVCLVFSSKATGQTTTDFVRQGPPQSWISPQTVPLTDTTLKADGSTFYRLVDWQRRIGPASENRYRHNAIELRTADGVEENSNFEISFDPTYQSVTIHNLDLIRDGQRLNRLNLEDFETYRRETDREKLLYDGTLQTSILIPDVRIGDILDYSYTISGKNEALGPHYKTYTTLQYAVPIQRQHERLLIHEDLPVNRKSFQDPKLPTESKIGPYNSYMWVQNELEAGEYEKNLPSWYYAQPIFELSSFASWSEVGEYFAPKYAFDYAPDGEVSQIAKTIRSETNDKKNQARLALDYVHQNIRYTGIEIGSGGYIPRPPEKTLSHKFGDCKDMTVLILALLRELDIEAYPVLVSTDHRDGVKDFIPSHAAFDHVIVRAEIDGRAYLLDGTRGPQLGDLDRIEQSSYGKGLLLKAGGAELIDLEARHPEYFKDVKDTFELISNPDKVTLKSESTYYGYEADGMSSWYLNSGIEAIEKNFLEFFQETYVDVEQIGAMEIQSFPDEGQFSITAHYSLGKGWIENSEETYQTFEAYAGDSTSDIPDFAGGERTMPYVISHPRKSRHKLVFKLDNTWDLEDEEISLDNPVFGFQKISKI